MHPQQANDKKSVISSSPLSTARRNPGRNVLAVMQNDKFLEAKSAAGNHCNFKFLSFPNGFTTLASTCKNFLHCYGLPKGNIVSLMKCVTVVMLSVVVVRVVLTRFINAKSIENAFDPLAILGLDPCDADNMKAIEQAYRQLSLPYQVEKDFHPEQVALSHLVLSVYEALTDESPRSLHLPCSLGLERGYRPNVTSFFLLFTIVALGLLWTCVRIRDTSICFNAWDGLKPIIRVATICYNAQSCIKDSLWSTMAKWFHKVGTWAEKIKSKVYRIITEGSTVIEKPFESRYHPKEKGHFSVIQYRWLTVLSLALLVGFRIYWTRRTISMSRELVNYDPFARWGLDPCDANNTNVFLKAFITHRVVKLYSHSVPSETFANLFSRAITCKDHPEEFRFARLDMLFTRSLGHGWKLRLEINAVLLIMMIVVGMLWTCYRSRVVTICLAAWSGGSENQGWNKLFCLPTKGNSRIIRAQNRLALIRSTETERHQHAQEIVEDIQQSDDTAQHRYKDMMLENAMSQTSTTIVNDDNNDDDQGNISWVETDEWFVLISKEAEAAVQKRNIAVGKTNVG